MLLAQSEKLSQVVLNVESTFEIEIVLIAKIEIKEIKQVAQMKTHPRKTIINFIVTQFTSAVLKGDPPSFQLAAEC